MVTHQEATLHPQEQGAFVPRQQPSKSNRCNTALPSPSQTEPGKRCLLHGNIGHCGFWRAQPTMLAQIHTWLGRVDKRTQLLSHHNCRLPILGCVRRWPLAQRWHAQEASSSSTLVSNPVKVGSPLGSLAIRYTGAIQCLTTRLGGGRADLQASSRICLRLYRHAGLQALSRRRRPLRRNESERQ